MPASNQAGAVELIKYVNRSTYFMDEIRLAHPLVWKAPGEAIAKSNEVMLFVHQHAARSATVNPDSMLGLWGSVRRYQISSILELFARNLDEGLAILRMATELVRIARTIATDYNRYQKWAAGSDIKSKFDLSDSSQKIVFDTYKFCCSYGTHGHKTSAVFLEETPIGREPSLSGVSMAASQWFLSFGHMHRVCLHATVRNQSELLEVAEVMVLVAEVKLLERLRNDPFFQARSGRN